MNPPGRGTAAIFLAGRIRHSVTTTLGGSRTELAEAVALAEAGSIEPKTEKFQVDDVAEVYEELEANEITGRAFLVP